MSGCEEYWGHRYKGCRALKQGCPTSDIVHSPVFGSDFTNSTRALAVRGTPRCYAKPTDYNNEDNQ